ncbi:hypothetical protein MTP04_17870 [Lysinibacillus sp. PLM2]|nr:hypothetical protein MTP04_17870 [Lysinibacillus sp. PLM2]
MSKINSIVYKTRSVFIKLPKMTESVMINPTWTTGISGVKNRKRINENVVKVIKPAQNHKIDNNNIKGL